jgi:hypothetical protein
MQEAKAGCPEGADISETYHRPAHIPGASAGTTSLQATPGGAPSRCTSYPCESPVQSVASPAAHADRATRDAVSTTREDGRVCMRSCRVC